MDVGIAQAGDQEFAPPVNHGCTRRDRYPAHMIYPGDPAILDQDGLVLQYHFPTYGNDGNVNKCVSRLLRVKRGDGGGEKGAGQNGAER